jgi:alkylation response protein AidB-like acyl-CoA dehydrogenase
VDFAFTEEQRMLADQARSFLSGRFPAERVAQLAEAGEHDQDAWREMAQLGWTGLSVSEERGGSGTGFLDEAVLFEELGHALYPGPYFSSVALSLDALANTEHVAELTQGSDAFTLAWAEPDGPTRLSDFAQVTTKAQPSGDEYILTGDKELVPDLQSATGVVVVAALDGATGLFLVRPDQSGASVNGQTTVDSTRRLGRLSLDGATGELLVGPEQSGDVIARIRLKAMTAAALESVGVCRRVQKLAVDHVGSRRQFDKPIGTYQAVSHQVVNIYVDTELARSLAYWAAWCLEEGDERAPVAAAAAKGFATEAAVDACEKAIQVHGGIGFTYEHELHRYYKRAQWLEAFEGHAPAQRAAVAEALL